MKKFIAFLFFCSFFPCLFPQIPDIIPASSSVARTSVANTGEWSAFSNPAMLGYIRQTEAAMGYDSRFLLRELSTKSGQLGFASNLINTGVTFSYSGYSLYHEMMIGLGFSRSFSDKFSIGMQVDYFTAFFQGSGTYRGVLLPQLGLSVKLSESFNLGFHSFNTFQSNINAQYVIKRLPSVFSLGTEYFFTPELTWRTQIDKEVSSSYRFATGVEYRMLEMLTIKTGVYGTDYLVPCLGFGFIPGRLRMDLNCELHPLLGLSTMAGVRYRFGK